MSKTVDISRFAAAITQMAKLSGKDHAEILRLEAGKILETAVRYTPKADRRKIETQVAKHTEFEFKNGKSDAGHNYKTKAGKEWFSPNHGETWYLITKWKVAPAVWRQYLRALSHNIEDFRKTVDRRIREALARRGMTAKTWLQIGAALGVNVKAPGFIQNANIPPDIGKGTVTTSGKEAVVTGANSSLVLINSRKGAGIIDRAIRARLKFIETSVRKGALDTLQSRARAFGHIFRS